MKRQSRREILAVLTGGIATVSGCSAFDDSSDESTPTTGTPIQGADTAAGDGTPESEGTPTVNGETTPNETADPGYNLGESEQAASWPNRRGPPTNTGASATGGPRPDAAIQFSAELRDGLAVSNRAPVVGSDALYAIGGAATPYEGTPPTFACYAYALSREDGSELWRRTLEIAEGSENGDLPTDTGLCLGPDGLYVAWIGPGNTLPLRIARLSTDDGSEQWRRTVEPTAGRARQPAVRGGLLYVFVNGRGIVFGTDDGSEQWRTESRLVEQPVPTVGSETAVTYHASSTDQPGGITAFDTGDGSVRWTIELAGPRQPIPAIVGETLYVADGDSFGLTGLAGAISDDPTQRPRRHIRALSLSDGSERWAHAYDTDGIHAAATAGGTSYVTVTDEHVYYALGFPPAAGLAGSNPDEETVERLREQVYRGPNVVALDRVDGSVAWRTKVGSQAQVYQPPIADGDSLYVLYRGVEANDEHPRVYAINRTNGQVQGSFGPVETTQPFAVADGTLYTHRQGELVDWE
jgi:outer membrane protein assembly factor BamB